MNLDVRSFVRSFVRCTLVGGGGKELPSFLVASLAIVWAVRQSCIE